MRSSRSGSLNGRRNPEQMKKIVKESKLNKIKEVRDLDPNDLDFGMKHMLACKWMLAQIRMMELYQDMDLNVEEAQISVQLALRNLRARIWYRDNTSWTDRIRDAEERFANATRYYIRTIHTMIRDLESRLGPTFYLLSLFVIWILDFTFCSIAPYIYGYPSLESLWDDEAGIKFSQTLFYNVWLGAEEPNSLKFNESHI